MSGSQDGLSIGELARRTGVPAATLRSWEDRYGFPRPQRLGGGHRRYAEGDTVTPFYDPMLALVIAHGRDRNSAIARLDGALADFAVDGVKTNIPFLRSMLASEAFEEGGHHTTFAEAFVSRPKTGSSSVGAT